MADYLFIDEGKKTYLTTAEIYDQNTKKGFKLARKCMEKGYNEDGNGSGLYCLCQGEDAKIKMTLYQRGEHIVITSHHRIDIIRHMKGICRHARDDNGKPYDSAYQIDDDGTPTYKIKDITSPAAGEAVDNKGKTYNSTRRDIFDPDTKEMTPTEFIRKLIITCHKYATRSGKELTSKYFYGMLVNSVLSINAKKDTFLALLNKGKLTNDESYKNNNIIIFGPVEEILQGQNVTKISIKTNGKSEKYVLSENDIYKRAADDFKKRYGADLVEASENYAIICFALTSYSTQRPMWLQFHMISMDGCYCDTIYEYKAYALMSKFIKNNERFTYYKPFIPEGGDYKGESNLIPAAYLINKATGKKIAIIEIFDGTDPKIKEIKLRTATLPVVYYDTKTEETWVQFNEMLSKVATNAPE